MAVMKVIELMAQSPDSWEDAARLAVREATDTIRGVQSVYIKHFMAEVRDGKVVNWRVDAKVTFRVESNSSSTSASKTSSRGNTSGKSAAKKTSARKTGR